MSNNFSLILAIIGVLTISAFTPNAFGHGLGGDQAEPLTFGDNTIEVIGSNPDESQCGVIVDGSAKWIDVGEKKEFLDLSVKVLESIAVHTPEDTVVTQGYWMCIVHIDNQINYTFVSINNGAMFSFGGHDISVIGVGNDFTKCGIEVDGVVKWGDIDDTKEFGDFEISIIYLFANP